jgi:hypothetical protein
MNTTPFSEYALSTVLSPDAIYTVELLMDRVRHIVDPGYWDEPSHLGEDRERPDYQPHFSKDLVIPAGNELQKLSWLSLQRVRNAERPVRDLNVLQFLPDLSELFLIDNDVTDISPLAGCSKLKKLDLTRNPVRDISALVACPTIEVLRLSEAPIEDFSVLSALPRLRELKISAGQIPVFTRLKGLPHLQKLLLGLETFHSFEGFPEMPELRAIQDAHVTSPQGLERFPKLENLNLTGQFCSLEPLRELKALTHLYVSGSRVQSLEPLKGLSALRDLSLSTDACELDLGPLYFLPALHEVAVGCSGKKSSSLDKLRQTLPSWDVEFRSPQPRHTPSLALEVVDQETFDIYNSKEPFNRTDSDGNERFLQSELEWLDAQLEEVLKVDFEQDEDYSIPFRWLGARSRTVVLLSDQAVEAFPRLVLQIQKVLAHANKDWIIYFQSDEVEVEQVFVVWIYPDRIMVTKKYEKTVRKLIKAR